MNAADIMLRALREIQRIVHQKTPATEPAIHHWQRDFDAIRKICAETVGPFVREGAEP